MVRRQNQEEKEEMSWTVRWYETKRKWELFGPFKRRKQVLDCINELLIKLPKSKYGLLVERL
jgi:hypothetical protein